MSRERELLKRVRDTLCELKEIHYTLYWDIQSILDQPEQQPEAWIVINKETGYRIQVSYFPDLYNKDMFEVIPLYTSPPKREPINHNDILDRSINGSFEYRDGFMDGVMFAEKMHGIGVDDEN